MPQFEIKTMEGIARSIPSQLKAESWNKKQKIWNSLFQFDLSPGQLGYNSLKIGIPIQEKFPLEKPLPIRLFN